jgi:SpoVK/Ycf46/Vps4 family AAA+-type ATPase
MIPERIGTAFSNVQLPQSTIETVRRLVMLPLSRPDAFSYGVLKNNKINGVLFYGPPGTGKTHLARAVATESGATMLEVSGAQLFQKWVGESEKAIRGMFSLAAKLKPCFIFIDEADNIFRNRKEEDSNYRREMLNQLLSEWDGVNTSNMLVMAATNRPWELDKAVLRRLPTRILVDMPTIEDRQAIFRIYLKNEQLDDDVDIADLARRSQSCTGSDIKNLCVSAALACVWEEEEKQIQQQRDMPPKLREKLRYTQNREVVPRVLYMRHFETAMMEVMASTDTALMTQIRDFSKAYGGDMMASQGNHKQRQQFKMMFMETPQGAHVPDENLAKHEEESKKKKQWPQVETFTHIEEVEPTRLPTSLDTA